jgi:hypothetical protein
LDNALIEKKGTENLKAFKELLIKHMNTIEDSFYLVINNKVANSQFIVRFWKQRKADIRGFYEPPQPYLRQM